MSEADDEEWRPAVGFEGYEVSSLGRVRSWHPANGKSAGDTPRIMSLWVSKYGYPEVCLRVGGKKKTMRVHRLVTLAFHGAPEPGMDVCCHNDGVPSNNRADNLRWDSHKGNYADKVKHGYPVLGEAAPTAALTEAQVLEIDAALRLRLQSHRQIAEQYGVSQGAISYINTGASWSWLTGRPNVSQKGSGKHGGRRVGPVKVGS